MPVPNCPAHNVQMIPHADKFEAGKRWAGCPEFKKNGCRIKFKETEDGTWRQTGVEDAAAPSKPLTLACPACGVVFVQQA